MMNKQIEELALRVANSSVDFQRNDIDSAALLWVYTESFLAELTKQEPVATKLETWKQFDYFHVSFEDSERLKALPVGAQLFAAPIPQADLVAEIERLKVRADFLDHKSKCLDMERKSQEKIIDQLRQQLSAAQQDNDALVRALEELACLGNGNVYGNSQGNVIAQQAIAAHKARVVKDSLTTEFDTSGENKARQGKEES